MAAGTHFRTILGHFGPYVIPRYKVQKPRKNRLLVLETLITFSHRGVRAILAMANVGIDLLSIAPGLAFYRRRGHEQWPLGPILVPF